MNQQHLFALSVVIMKHNVFSVLAALFPGKENASIKDTDQGGSGSVFREIVRLTDSITLIDNKGTKDYSSRHIDEFIAQLCKLHTIIEWLLAMIGKSYKLSSVDIPSHKC